MSRDLKVKGVIHLKKRFLKFLLLMAPCFLAELIFGPAEINVVMCVPWIPIAMIASAIIGGAASRRGGNRAWQPSSTDLSMLRRRILNIMSGEADPSFIPEFDQGFFDRMGGGDMDWDSVIEGIARRKSLNEFMSLYGMDVGAQQQGAAINQRLPSTGSAIGSFMSPFLQYMQMRNQPGQTGEGSLPTFEDYVQNQPSDYGNFDPSDFLWGEYGRLNP